MDRAGLKDPKIQRYGDSRGNNEVLVALEQRETNESALDQGKNTIIKALESSEAPQAGKLDLNNTGPSSLQQLPAVKGPACIWAASTPRPVPGDRAHRSTTSATKQHGGVLTSWTS